MGSLSIYLPCQDWLCHSTSPIHSTFARQQRQSAENFDWQTARSEPERGRIAKKSTQSHILIQITFQKFNKFSHFQYLEQREYENKGKNYFVEKQFPFSNNFHIDWWIIIPLHFSVNFWFIWLFRLTQFTVSIFSVFQFCSPAFFTRTYDGSKRIWGKGESRISINKKAKDLMV